jgi:hypothetical protein
VSQIAKAQAYPTKPVRIIVGLAAGGPTDIFARLIGQWLQERLGKPFATENRPGGGTNIATELVVRAPPDGRGGPSIGADAPKSPPELPGGGRLEIPVLQLFCRQANREKVRSTTVSTLRLKPHASTKKLAVPNVKSTRQSNTVPMCAITSSTAGPDERSLNTASSTG